MARIRSIKPEFCSSADTGALTREARLFFLQLFLEADDAGRMLWIPRKLCGVLYPHDEDVDGAMLNAWAIECQAREMVVLYRIGGVDYLQIRNWSKHQKISNPTASRLPEPPKNPESPAISGTAPEKLTKKSERLGLDLGSGSGIGIKEGDISATPPEPPSAPPALTLVSSNPEPQSPDDRIVDLVIEQYHDFLPDCRKIFARNPKLRKRILACHKLARQTLKEQNLNVAGARFWEAFFGECQDDEWLCGRRPNPNNPNWKQNLPTLLEEERFADIVNRAIARTRRAGAA